MIGMDDVVSEDYSAMKKSERKGFEFKWACLGDNSYRNVILIFSFAWIHHIIAFLLY